MTHPKKTAKNKELDMHPDEVFKGIVDYVASTGYALQTSSKIDLSFFDHDFITSLTIQPPVYSYKGITRYASKTTDEEDNG